jgi:hypothetical protein
MAVFVATDYKITLNGTNLSTSLVQAELGIEADDIDTTAFGSTWRTRVGGLKAGSVTLQFNQDFAAGAVDATLFPLFGSLGTVVISPTSSAISATNPSYTAICLVNSYTPFASSVGDLATVSVTWPTSGTVARGTA